MAVQSRMNTLCGSESLTVQTRINTLCAPGSVTIQSHVSSRMSKQQIHFYIWRISSLKKDLIGFLLFIICFVFKYLFKLNGTVHLNVIISLQRLVDCFHWLQMRVACCEYAAWVNKRNASLLILIDNKKCKPADCSIQHP